MLHKDCRLYTNCLSKMAFCCVLWLVWQLIANLTPHTWQKFFITVAMFDALSEHVLCVMTLQESKKGSKYTLNLAPGASERTTPRKAAPRTPKKSQSAVPALDFNDSENTEPFRASQELVSRR